MKRILTIICVLFVSASAFSQSLLTKRYINYMKNAQITQNDFYGMQLPKIAGTWYFVDYASGNDSHDDYDGKTVEKPFKTVYKAYTECTSGRGDGIVVLSRSVSGTSYSTNIGDGRLTWSKYGITVYGVAAGNGYGGRARIATTTDGDSCAALMIITGQNNRFYNIYFYHSPNQTTHTALRTTQVSAIQVAGARNAFINCHFNCSPDVNTYAAYMSAINLRASSDESTYDGCYFGSSSFNPGNTACSWIYLMGAAAQHFFRDCIFLQQVSAGTAFGAFETSGATVLNGIDIFKNCTFAVWRANTHANIAASWFIGTKPNTGNIVLHDCVTVGFTALDAVGGNDVVWTNQPASNAAGGIGVAP
ncbi:MAG: hypothetical protein ABIH42_09160 [Planctomycetota bacterium]